MSLRRLLATPLFFIAAFVAAQDKSPSLDLLKRYMVGSYSSAAQAARDTNYFNIELELVRI